MNISSLRISPDGKFKLTDRKTDETPGIDKVRALAAMPRHTEQLAELHNLLYAEHKRAVLIVLQGMDASGKDGTIKHVMSGVNPQGCTVTSFKQPTARELDHDFLWRIHAEVPARGDIGIFNRSHYEDVLVARVRGLVPEAVWRRRYEQINAFEKMLLENDVHILKFFLHIGSDEQRRRFDERLADPRKNWKSSVADFAEREYWAAYQAAYQDAIARCSTRHAPWYVIPADHKWFRNYAIGEIVIRTLESFKMEYPRLVAGSPHT